MSAGNMLDQQITQLWDVIAGLTDALLPEGVRVQAPVALFTSQWMVTVLDGGAINMFYGESMAEALASAGVSLRRADVETS